jgi:hypothetical protein
MNITSYGGGREYHRLRARFTQVVNQLTIHAENANEKSLLKKLSVGMARDWEDDQDVPVNPDQIRRRWELEQIYGGFSDCMFALEPLVALRPALQVQVIHITSIPGWLSTCLEMAVKGNGGELAKIEWLLNYPAKSGR